ncbi:DEAD-box ATP-dependent RNA helicase 42 [Balamuthia mandrillaris]
MSHVDKKRASQSVGFRLSAEVRLEDLAKTSSSNDQQPDKDHTTGERKKSSRHHHTSGRSVKGSEDGVGEKSSTSSASRSSRTSDDGVERPGSSSRSHKSADDGGGERPHPSTSISEPSAAERSGEGHRSRRSHKRTASSSHTSSSQLSKDRSRRDRDKDKEKDKERDGHDSRRKDRGKDSSQRREDGESKGEQRKSSRDKSDRKSLAAALPLGAVLEENEKSLSSGSSQSASSPRKHRYGSQRDRGQSVGSTTPRKERPSAMSLFGDITKQDQAKVEELSASGSPKAGGSTSSTTRTTPRLSSRGSSSADLLAENSDKSPKTSPKTSATAATQESVESPLLSRLKRTRSQSALIGEKMRSLRFHRKKTDPASATATAPTASSPPTPQREASSELSSPVAPSRPPMARTGSSLSLKRGGTLRGKDLFAGGSEKGITEEKVPVRAATLRRSRSTFGTTSLLTIDKEESRRSFVIHESSSSPKTTEPEEKPPQSSSSESGMKGGTPAALPSSSSAATLKQTSSEDLQKSLAEVASSPTHPKEEVRDLAFLQSHSPSELCALLQNLLDGWQGREASLSGKEQQDICSAIQECMVTLKQATLSLQAC